MDSSLKILAEWDQMLVRAAKEIKVLTSLSWPLEHQVQFLDGWHKKNPRIPRVEPNRADYGQALSDLRKIRNQVDGDHPIGKYIRRTAQSYIHAAHMLENLGTPIMLEHCIALYGRPGDRLKGSHVTVLDAARYFIQTADETSRQFDFGAGDYCVTAGALKSQLEEAISQVFTRHQVRVVLDPKMASKAAAGPKRIRLRDDTCFSRFDFGQLLQHEILVHTLTALNGLEQPFLGSMGLGAPRTTSTQEGLATFAELVTGAIDLSRLKRIALRILAVNMGLEGADFMEVFRFFLESGQAETESYHSTVRVFRGGDPNGSGIVFTKDAVYLQGLISAHTFFRWAMSHDKLAYLHYSFAGRLTFDDVAELEPFFKNGTIQMPLYMPQWLESVQALAAYLAFSLFANRIDLDQMDADETGFSETNSKPS